MPCRLRCAARRGKAATTRTRPRGALRRPATASVSALKEQNTRPPISEGNHARLPQTLISSFHWRWHAHALSLGSSSSQEANPTKKAAGVSTGGHWKATPYSRLCRRYRRFLRRRVTAPPAALNAASIASPKTPATGTPVAAVSLAIEEGRSSPKPFWSVAIT